MDDFGFLELFWDEKNSPGRPLIRWATSPFFYHNFVLLLLDGDDHKILTCLPDSISHHAASTLKRDSDSEKPLSNTII